MLWTAAQKRGASLSDLTHWLSTNPAKLIGQSHRKGQIAQGYDADLLILNPEQTFEVTAELLQHRHKVSPYVGQRLRGVVEQTYLAGQPVYQRPEFVALNQGQLLTSR
ncbi:amidohydrolase family protein [Hymenobacter cellulosilyticus]|uniref:amidohydrolase family protein n=1 Tax=Hymenobacter cellulosilyticus TaxID=2932248 RepID=UPI0021D3FC03|nr:amidohydrolase family protein [Hymenobacter cellulosilyticus]